VCIELALQLSRDKMDDLIEEGSMEEEEDEGSNSSFFARGGNFYERCGRFLLCFLRFCVH